MGHTYIYLLNLKCILYQISDISILFPTQFSGKTSVVEKKYAIYQNKNTCLNALHSYVTKYWKLEMSFRLMKLRNSEAKIDK